MVGQPALGQAQIEQKELSFGRQFDVGGFDVPMDNPFIMQVASPKLTLALHI